MKSKKVLIWTSDIDKLLLGKGSVGGLTIQMMLWAKTFNKHKWAVYTFSSNKAGVLDGINYLKFPKVNRASLLIDVIFSFYYIIFKRIDLIVFRGASRNLFIINLFARLTKSKVVFMGAHDVNFMPGKELISGRNYNKRLYRLGLFKTKKIVVQNKDQYNCLKTNYNKESLIIPNIWDMQSLKSTGKRNILWVANFRPIKRPEMFVNLSRAFPDQQFVMAGFPLSQKLFNDIKLKSEGVNNLKFLGPISFQESEALFDSAKLLVNTSLKEGFPNTFLQAWSRNIPVLSTVNPSELITGKNLGEIAVDQIQLVNKLNVLLDDGEKYAKIEDDIETYFKSSHEPSLAFEKLINFIYE